MAKKLNKKVALVVGILLVGIVCVLAGGVVYLKVHRDPDRALAQARQALEAGDYKKAESQLGRAFAYGKDDAYKIERLFELADFHLIHNAQHQAEWNKAMGCWSKIVSIDTNNVQARRKLLDFYYQAAEAGDARAWQNVLENTTKLLDTLKAGQAEPDTTLLTAHAKSLLYIAQRGETTDRRQHLSDCMTILEQLKEKEPGNAEVYLLLAEAAGLQGELDTQSGVIRAAENARQKALEHLQAGVERADDKSAAVANLLRYRLQSTVGDPNGLEAFRAEIETYRTQIQPNDVFWLVVSIAYEFPGRQSAQAEINQAIEAVRRAHEMKPDNFEYVLRLARLMYRKANAFADAAALADARQIAEDALSMDAVQDVTGPLQGRNLNYRFTLNAFLADLYLDHALTARREGRTAEADELTAKAESCVAVISGILGTSDSPTAQKYQGLLALAKDQKDKGLRLLHKAYEQWRALDRPQEFSNADPLVCAVLADLMKDSGEPGMRREFLQWAIYNNSRYVLQKPKLILDYAEVLGQLRAWNNTERMVEEYQNRYGANGQSQMLAIRAAAALGKFDQARRLLAQLDGTSAPVLQLRLEVLTAQIAQIAGSIAEGRQAQPPKEPTAEQLKKLDTLRAERNTVLQQALQLEPAQMDPQLLNVICMDMIQNKQAPQAAAFLDIYLAANPDAYGLQLLRLRASQDDPAAQPTAQLQEQAADRIQNPRQKALLRSALYRAQGDYEKAMAALMQDAGPDAANDPEILNAQFDIAVDQKDSAKAEGLLQMIRSKNADGCEGGLAAARVEMLKENYPQALRRLDECLTLRPLSSYLYYLKSQVQHQMQDSTAAIQNARQAVQMNPQHAAYARNLAMLLFARNNELGTKVTPEQRSEAEQALTLAMLLNPADWQLQGLYAESIQQQAPDRALQIRQRLLQTVPTASNALMLGNMALRMAQSEWDTAKRTGLVELAGKAYQQAIDLEPDNDSIRQAYADYLRLTQQSDKALDLLKGDQNLLWKYYLRGGQFEQAEAILKDLLAKHPDDVLLYQGLVIASEGAGKRQQVKEYLDALVKLEQTKDGELWIMQKYLDNAFTAEAESRIPSFQERYPDDITILLIKAWTAMGHGRLDEALSLTNLYLEKDTANAGAWRLRGRLYRLMNQQQKAIEDLQRSKGLQDNPMVRMELANVYNETRQITAAIGELASALDDPKAPIQVRLMLEALYQKNNRAADLDKFYQGTLEKYPNSAFWHYRAGMYYLSQKNYTRAEELLLSAWKLASAQNQPNLELVQGYLEVLYAAKQYDKLITFAGGLIDTPGAPVAYMYLGLVQSQQGQKDKAIDSFYKALDKAQTSETMQELILQKVRPAAGEEVLDGWVTKTLAADAKSLPALLLACRLAQEKSAYNKAIEYADQCIGLIAPDNPQLFLYNLKKVDLLIMAYAKTADSSYFERAADMLEKMLQIQPNNSSLLNNMAYLLADNDQQLEKALNYARSAHQQDPGNPVFLDTYAFVQCKVGQYDTAEQNLLRAIQIYDVSGQPVPWDVYKHLAMAQEGLNKPQQAMETYQKALDSAQEMPDKEKQQLQKAIERLRQQ